MARDPFIRYKDFICCRSLKALRDAFCQPQGFPVQGFGIRDVGREAGQKIRDTTLKLTPVDAPAEGRIKHRGFLLKRDQEGVVIRGQFGNNLHVNGGGDVLDHHQIEDVRRSAGAKKCRLVGGVNRAGVESDVVKESTPIPVDDSAPPQAMFGVKVPGD
ncbi:hypothetical protein QE152_g30675 [Popillia japonica]|uniref:Uncharacterized protein n=1 Tax=Popillia japonica TaxID=7064 RepID=A0AAW1JE00_POPJA